jgi:prolyl-tRNA editing enzyme YbaK/EbsC (Cys-tRNA(Pro) deacylase)
VQAEDSSWQQHGTLGRRQVEEFVAQAQLTQPPANARLLHSPTPTHTVAESAAALGLSTEHIIKSLVLCVDGMPPVLALAAGTQPIQLHLVAHHLRVSRASVRLATAAEVLNITGFMVGTVPPFAHRQPLRTLVDAPLCSDTGAAAYGRVVGGGGDLHSHVSMEAAALLTATGGEAVALRDATDGSYTSPSLPRQWSPVRRVQTAGGAGMMVDTETDNMHPFLRCAAITLLYLYVLPSATAPERF